MLRVREAEERKTEARTAKYSVERRQLACLTVGLFKEYYLLHARLFSALAEIGSKINDNTFFFAFCIFSYLFYFCII